MVNTMKNESQRTMFSVVKGKRVAFVEFFSLKCSKLFPGIARQTRVLPMQPPMSSAHCYHSTTTSYPHHHCHNTYDHHPNYPCATTSTIIFSECEETFFMGKNIRRIFAAETNDALTLRSFQCIFRLHLTKAYLDNAD